MDRNDHGQPACGTQLILPVPLDHRDTMNTKFPNAICLIGMPGAGKSTTGKLLAERTGKDLIDTDDLIRASAGKSLQQIVDQGGQQALRDIEQEVICTLACKACIIATGGSAIYSKDAMAHLAEIARPETVWISQSTYDRLEDKNGFTPRTTSVAKSEEKPTTAYEMACS